MNVLELFAGIGGMSLGLERAGMDRCRVLGNAVVPAVAEHIGRLITTDTANSTDHPLWKEVA